MKRKAHAVRRAVLLVLFPVVLLAGAGGFVLRGRLVASLPQLDGERALPGLAAPVTIERDAHGVPTIRGASRIDVARATGFLHAQERFFQMDLLRRRAAGELAEIVGPAVVKVDRGIRVHRFRAVAQRVVAAAAVSDRALVQAYADGVNAGLAALGARPFEYLVLRADPAPWRPEDTVLVALAMYVELQDENGVQESALGVMRDVLPAPLYEFLAPRGGEWDTPMVGQPFEQPPIPGPEVFDVRGQGATMAWGPPREDPVPLGSNNWALAGRLTAHGGAIVANDMHLGIAVPNTWYRASLAYAAGADERRVSGVTLPGTPAVIVGSNTHVAWGFTNTEADWGDLVVLESDPRDEDSYLTPEGPRKLERVRETIRVLGAPDETLEVLQSIWGPVIDRDHRGRLRVLHWVAHETEASNLGLVRLEGARTLDEALRIANEIGAPAQNFTCADAAGRVGWTILGRIPRRVGYDGRTPVSWADGGRRWDGWLTPDEYPRIVDPPGGRIWTANARVVDGAMLAKLGDGGYDLGARARQIRDGLLALDKATEHDMLKIQLDDRALFLGRWRDLLLGTLRGEAIAASPLRAELKTLVEAWSGRASVDSAGYRLVRAFRSSLREQLLAPLTAACKKADPRFDVHTIPRPEGPLWALVTERPAHLLNPRFRSWDDQLLAVVDAVIESLVKDGSPLAAHAWGKRNTAKIQHPLSRAVPRLASWLDMPREPLPGDDNMPRFQSAGAGASERMAVSPGREAEGIFHMPCGQSGHPLSGHYRDGHEAWARGEATPFLPGSAAHTLKLTPGR